MINKTKIIYILLTFVLTFFSHSFSAVYLFNTQSSSSSSIPAQPKQILVYQNAGTYTYTIPSGVSYIHVKVWGAGGGGTDGGCDCSGTYGGGGGYAEGIYEVSAGDVLTIIVGAGGKGGPNRAASGGGVGRGIESSGQPGGTSEVRKNGTVLLRATGGQGGTPQGGWYGCPGKPGSDGCGYGGNILNACGKGGKAPFGGGPGTNKWAGEWPGGGGGGGQGGISYEEWCKGESGGNGADGGVIIELY